VTHRDCRSTDGTSVCTLTLYYYIYNRSVYSQFQSRVLLLTLERKRERDNTAMTEYDACAHGHSKCVSKTTARVCACAESVFII